MNINLEVITSAISWWENDDFSTYSDVPYLVDPDIMAFTCPPGVIDKRMTHYNGKQYVASAEQSFLQMEKDGNIPYIENKKYMALTPCYRDEEVLDEFHYNIFLKLELFVYHVVLEEEVDYGLACELQSFFNTYGMQTEIVRTDIGWDIEYKGLELGSFGYRESPKGVLYVYGTGLAEPRASIAMAMNEGVYGC